MFAKRGKRQLLFLPVHHFELCSGDWLGADMQDHIVAEACQLVVGAATFELNLDAANARRVLLERAEKRRGDDEFLLLD